MRGIRIIEARRARSLRHDQTTAESRLWNRLRAQRVNGFKFIRQEPIGPYFADFTCRKARLIIEIDGATHSTDEEIAADLRRTAFLEAQGYQVIRFQNAEIFENIEGVLETILARLEGRETL